MQRNVMIALAAVALVALAAPQLAEAGCMSTPKVEDFFTTEVRGITFLKLFITHLRLAFKHLIKQSGWETSRSRLLLTRGF